jgi:transcriptional regulator with XRE-family HTH domain
VTDPRIDEIGPRLRAARVRAGLTLDALAERAAISPSTLSRLESGKRQANLELLLPLARELRLGLDELVPPAVPDPRVRRRGHKRDGVTMVPLAPEGSPVQTVRITYDPLPPGPLPAQRTHDGYEWLYVISGRLRLRLAEHDLVLTPGEAAEFDTRTPHALSCDGEEPCVLVAIFNADGERIHTRAAPREPRAAGT